MKGPRDKKKIRFKSSQDLSDQITDGKELSLQDFPQIPAAWQRRCPLVRGEKLEAWRLVHGAADRMAGLYVDYYLGRFLITAEQDLWLKQRPALEAALSKIQHEITPAFAPRFFWVANLPNRRATLPAAAPDKFEVTEDAARFEVHLGEGPHTGLFLDQRENRRQVRTIAKYRRCLNLFCHTGAFTVAALQGGASEVVSVDLSKNYLTWLERNLELNDLDDKPHRDRAMDALAYLAKTGREAKKFDLILLDPPTFGRGKGSTFSTTRDYGRLLAACERLLSPAGTLLACLNTRNMTAKEFRDYLKNAVKPWGRKILRAGSAPPDFPGTQGPLKAFWIE